jgi:drug/metabolite transporter (DMT)-like permease
MIGELAALGAALSWAIAPILYRSALANTKPVSANIVRCSINGAVLVAVLLAGGLAGWLTALPIWVIVLTVVSGVIGLGVGDTLYLYGIKALGVSRAVPLASSYPLFSFIWSILLLGQPIIFTAIVGAALILLGIYLLTRPKTEETTLTRRAVALGLAASLATALVWSLGITLMNAAVMAANVTSIKANYAIVTVRIASLGILLLSASPLIDRDRGFLKIKRRDVALLCIGGLVANGVGWLMMNYSFTQIMASQAIPISSTSPLFAALAGFLLFHEKVTLKRSGGVAVGCGGCFNLYNVSDVELKKSKESEKAPLV